MSDYTPSTEEVRRQYAFGVANETFSSWGDAEKWFDRWLAEVKAQAWQEGTHAMALELQYHFGENHKCVTNPYRQGEEQ